MFKHALIAFYTTTRKPKDNYPFTNNTPKDTSDIDKSSQRKVTATLDVLCLAVTAKH